MEKSATLNLRINPTLKQNAESVLSRLGVYLPFTYSEKSNAKYEKIA